MVLGRRCALGMLAAPMLCPGPSTFPARMSHACVTPGPQAHPRPLQPSALRLAHPLPLSPRANSRVLFTLLGPGPLRPA